MTGLVKYVAIVLAFSIFCVFSVSGIGETSVKDIYKKLKLQEKTLPEKYYESFQDYIKYISQSICNVEDKLNQGANDIAKHYQELTDSDWFRNIQGYFVTEIKQPIKEVAQDFKESEAAEDVNDLFLTWIWNPVRNINVTEIEEKLEENLEMLQESDLLRRPRGVIGQYLSDTYNRWTSCNCKNASQLSEEKLGKQKWSDMPLVTNSLWFFLGFASFFVIMFVYSYVKELKEEFNSFEEFMEAVQEPNYPLDEKKSNKQSNPSSDAGTETYEKSAEKKAAETETSENEDFAYIS